MPMPAPRSMCSRPCSIIATSPSRRATTAWGTKRKREAIERVGALVMDRRGALRPAPDQIEYERRSVSTLLGGCVEPSNVKSGGKSCPIRFQCGGCDHYRPDPSYIPEIEQEIRKIKSDILEAQLCAAPQVVDNLRYNLAMFESIHAKMTANLEQLDPHERAGLDAAIGTIRRARELQRNALPLHIIDRNTDDGRWLTPAPTSSSPQDARSAATSAPTPCKRCSARRVGSTHQLRSARPRGRRVHLAALQQPGTQASGHRRDAAPIPPRAPTAAYRLGEGRIATEPAHRPRTRSPRNRGITTIRTKAARTPTTNPRRRDRADRPIRTHRPHRRTRKTPRQTPRREHSSPKPTPSSLISLPNKVTTSTQRIPFSAAT